MKQVLERRDDNWKKLREYVLDETERLDVRGPGQLPIEGFRREFTWYLRDGLLVRSPVKYNGVTLDETERRAYEDRWLREEEERQARLDRRRAEAAGKPADLDRRERGGRGVRGFEPRLISEAYFLDLPYEPGNYYVAGRETFEGREVVRIEYYPKRLFADQDEEDDEGRKVLERMDKVVMVTLWVDPQEHQIAKYTLDNVGFGFLPGRWLVHLDDLKASMTMGQPFAGVWLPREIAMSGALTLATGTYQLRYTREFHDYRQADVKSRIRIRIRRSADMTALARVRVVVAAALVAAVVAAPAGAGQAASPAVVAAFRVHGNYRTPDADVIRLTGVELGDALDAATLRRVEERLRASGRFADVEVKERFQSLTDTTRAVLVVARHREGRGAGRQPVRPALQAGGQPVHVPAPPELHRGVPASPTAGAPAWSTGWEPASGSRCR